MYNKFKLFIKKILIKKEVKLDNNKKKIKKYISSILIVDKFIIKRFIFYILN